MANYPRISNNIVVWQDKRNGSYDIYGADISDPYNIVEFPVCVFDGDQTGPSISGDIVIWQDNRNGDWDIYGKNLTTDVVFEITLGQSDPPYPEISDNIIIWQKYVSSGNYDIYGIDLNECLEDIPGDIDGNCKVDFVDFSILASHWLDCNLVFDELCN